MNRTYMQKGIGAAPFAIVAALIIALAAGFWATQPAQAADGDVVLEVEPIDVGTFIPPGGADQIAFGPTGLVTEQDATLDAAAAADKVVFRGATERNAWVEIQASLEDANDHGTDPDPAANAYTLMLEVEGEGSLTQSGLTSGTLAAQRSADTDPYVVQFAVYTTGTPGGFTVTAADAGDDVLTADNVKKAGSLKGQWVGPAVSADVLTAAPARSGVELDTDSSDTTPDVKIATLFGKVSPSAFVSGSTPGLTPTTDTAGVVTGNVAFLFQLKDSAGQVALASPVDARDAPRVRVVTDAGDDVTLSSTVLSLAIADTEIDTDDKGAYAAITDEEGLATATGYPALADDANDADGSSDVSGLIAIGLDAVAEGTAATGRIIIDLDRGDSVEHAFAIAGDPNKDESTVSAAASPVNLGPGEKHTRTVSLRDANGTPVPLAAADIESVIAVSEDEADKADLVFALAAKSGSEGDYTLTITANTPVEDDADTVDVDESEGTRTADVGLHAFTVLINELDGTTEVVKKTSDADGNPLETHIAGGITGLSVVSVTNRAGDDILGDGEVSVAPLGRITITVAAVSGDHGRAPKNKSVVTLLRDDSDREITATTGDTGEATFTIRAGREDHGVDFLNDADSYLAALTVRVADPDAPAEDAGPRIYTLASQAGGDFHNWTGGVSSSSEFENVANLVAVWKWTGGMWVGYVSAPNAPAATKTNYSLQDGDTLFVVANGPVDLTLD